MALQLTLSKGNGWVVEGYVSPHSGSRNTLITITYQLNIAGSARMKVYLTDYDPTCNCFKYTIYKTILDYFPVDPSNISPIHIKLNNTKSWFYRICLKVAYNGSYYRDCDSGNQFLLIDSTPIIYNIIETKPKIYMSAKIPNEIHEFSKIPISVSIRNTGENATIKVYSYIYNKTNIYFGNSKEIFLAKGTQLNFTLYLKTPYRGNYTLKVRAKGFSDIAIPVKILPKENVSLSLFVDKVKNKTRITVSNLGKNFENFSLIVVGNNSQSFDVSLGPRRSYEIFSNISPYAVLVARDFLTAEIFSHNSSCSCNFTLKGSSLLNVSTPKKYLEDKSLPITKEMLLYTNKEMLLYSVIVSFSLVGLWLMIR